MVWDPPRKRLRSPKAAVPKFDDLAALQRAIRPFLAEWDELAHPFRWTTQSFDKLLAKVDDAA
jgi:hypothetical protein